MAQSSDPQIFVESIFPKAFGTAAQDGYMEAQESYQSLFEDTAKYNAIMSALAEIDTLIGRILWEELPGRYSDNAIFAYRQKIYEYMYTRYKEVA